jgi:site-specific recombinase XerD
VTNIGDVTEAMLDGLVGTWIEPDRDLQSTTRHNYVRVVQDFFGLAHHRKWITENPAANLVRPKRNRNKQTMPFDLHSEDPLALAAIPNWMQGIKKPVNTASSIWSENPVTASALMYVLRFTGLRISDAIMFEPRSLVKRTIKGREVYCYFLPRQEKTDEPVFCVLPTDVAEYIIHAPRITDEHAFYDNEGKIFDDQGRVNEKKAVLHQREWGTRFRQNVLRFVEVVSGVPNIHPRRFRDTFAVDLLQHPTDIRQVSKLLGHTDVATTLKSYAPWMPHDQKTAAEAMMKTWESKSNIIPLPIQKSA